MHKITATIIDKIKKRPLLFLTLTAFAATESVLFVRIQLTSSDTYERLAYGSVILACLFALFTSVYHRGDNFLRAGLLFTVLADYFLIISEPLQETVGVVVFSAAQICYAIALFLRQDGKQRKFHLILRISLITLILPIASVILGEHSDALTVLSLFYYVNLCLNIVFAFLDFPHFALFGVGLVFFALCDAALGLGYFAKFYLNVESDNPLYYLYYSTVNIPWLFYVPSQTLIAISPLTMKD